MTFGQFGSIYTDETTATITPPTGRLITAITMLEDVTFSSLVAKDSAQSFNSEAAGAGSGGEALPSDQVFPRGVTIYGKWKELSLNGGAIVAYIGV